MTFSYLKENGELLSITQTSGLSLSNRSLDLYRNSYDKLVEYYKLYPAFIRFFWAFALDLERLGMKGDISQTLTHKVLEDRVFDFETSDTRRWEYINLMGYSGREVPFRHDSREALEARTCAFFDEPDRFTKYNRPLFYDLTHIIFFWTNYGKTPFSPSDSLMTSLSYMGLLSYLDQDTDLLAEICLCFQFLGQSPPHSWLELCFEDLTTIHVQGLDTAMTPAHRSQDEYHIYVVLNWLRAFNGLPSFDISVPSGTPLFLKAKASLSTLATLSAKLHQHVMARRSVYIPQIGRQTFSSEQTYFIDRALDSTPLANELLSKLTDNRIVF